MADNSDVEVRFGASSQDVEQAADRISSHIGQLSNQAEHAEELFKYLGERMIEVFALDEIKNFAVEMADIGEQIQRTMDVTGLSSGSVQTLGYAMQMAGGNAERSGMMIARFERYVEEAVAGNNQYSAAFEKLGINVQQLKTMGIEELLQKTADGFNNIADPVTRAAVAAQFGERDFLSFLAAIKETPGGISALKGKLQDLNDYLSYATIKSLKETKDKLIDLDDAAQGAGVAAMSTFKGAINGVIEDFTYAIVDIGKFIQWLGELQTVAGVDVVVAFGRMKEAIDDTMDEAVFAAQKIEIRWKEMGAILTAVATANFKLIGDIEKEADAEVAAAATHAVTALNDESKAYEQLKNAAIAAGNAVLKGAQVAEEATSSATNRTPLTGKKGKEDKTDYYKQDLENYQAYIENKEELDKGDVQAQIDDAQQWVDAMANAYGEDSKQYYEALKKKEEYQDTANKQLVKSFDDTLKPIDTAMDGMLRGVLQGTQTWQQAMAKAFDNFALSVIEDIAKMMLKWTAWEALQMMPDAGAQKMASAVGATIPSFLGGTAGAGGASQTAALTTNTAALTTLNANFTTWLAALNLNTTGQATSNTATTANTLATTTNAASTDTNTATQSTGILTWAENTIATIANTVATDAAAIGHFLGFDTGSWNLPMTMPAIVHQGEMIIPAQQAGEIRAGKAILGNTGGAASGAGSMAISINAVDAKSVVTLLNNPSIMRQFAKNLGAYQANNPSTRGNY